MTKTLHNNAEVYITNLLLKSTQLKSSRKTSLSNHISSVIWELAHPRDGHVLIFTTPGSARQPAGKWYKPICLPGLNSKAQVYQA